VTIDEVVVADEPGAWRAAGFEVAGEVSEIGAVRIRLAGRGAGRGLVEWSLRELGDGSLDGLPTRASDRPPPTGAAHPNGALALDHLVAFTPDLERTVAALERAGLDLRRLREGPTPGGAERQAFFRLGDVVLEVIEAPEGTRIREAPDGPARLWGLAFVVDDLERTADFLGERLGSPRDAVQPGRRIATLRRSAGLSPAVAFMTPARTLGEERRAHD
jgi:glyoxalase/bleomycin resistance protein/dioxygenase superfamily protein